ncbi:hypothetical protein GCM10023169_30960 [Georgenia halophila]|uniref:PspA/IM30 family protein n=1 Tax=Georgenia halophila TaxID=620889 RepID=A0ABP8LHK3_9MICO
MFDRIRRLVRANRAATQQPTDPLVALEQVHAHRTDRLEGARRAVADLAASRRRVEVLAQRTRAEIEDHDRRAESAVAAGNDDAAREHLRRSLTAGQRLEDLAGQHRRLSEQVRRLEDDLGRLEAQVEDSYFRVQSLRADHDAARAALGRRTDAVAQGQVEAGGVEREAEREVRRLQAKADAYQEVAGTDPGSDRVRAAFDELAGEDDVSRRLESLHKRVDPPAS